MDVYNQTIPADSDTVNFTCIRADFGDAPDSYATTLGVNGARHGLGFSLYLGAGVDHEPNGQPDPNALGDDNDGNDDEDGVVFGPLDVGATATITVTASAPGKLDAWLDFGGDGSWVQAGDRIFTSQPLAAGPNVLTFNVPVTAEQGATFARFRLSANGGLSYTGLTFDGEVEDYAVTLGQPASVGDFVWLDSNGDGIQGNNESGINQVTVRLYTPGNDGAPGTLDDVLKATTVTADDLGGNAGYYHFPGLAAGSYYILVTAPSGHAFTLKQQGLDPAKDSDINPASGRSDLFVLNAGQQNPDLDAGLHRPVSISGLVYLGTNPLIALFAQDASSQGIVNVPVTATNVSTGEVYTTTTNAQGLYSLMGVRPGTYDVSVPSMLAGMTLTTPSPVQVTALSGQALFSVNFGYQAPTAVVLASFTAAAS